MKTKLAENANWPKEETGESLFSSLLAKPSTLGKEPREPNFLPRTERESVEYYMEQYAQVIRPAPPLRARRCQICDGRDANCPVGRY